MGHETQFNKIATPPSDFEEFLRHLVERSAMEYDNRDTWWKTDGNHQNGGNEYCRLKIYCRLIIVQTYKIMRY